jgi:hypothetical protein
VDHSQQLQSEDLKDYAPDLRLIIYNVLLCSRLHCQYRYYQGARNEVVQVSEYVIKARQEIVNNIAREACTNFLKFWDFPKFGNQISIFGNQIPNFGIRGSI